MEAERRTSGYNSIDGEREEIHVFFQKGLLEIFCDMLINNSDRELVDTMLAEKTRLQ
jgi:hypothetical protein